MDMVNGALVLQETVLPLAVLMRGCAGGLENLFIFILVPAGMGGIFLSGPVLETGCTKGAWLV